jgi:hypothetical protein
MILFNMVHILQFIIYYILTVNESRLPKIFLTHQKNHVDHATESKIKKRRKNKQLKASVFSKLVRILTITLSSKIKHLRVTEIYIQTLE